MGRKMKDSGVEWIGEIPEDWKIERLKYQFNFGKGLAITKADLVADGIGVISYGQIHSKSNTGTSLNDLLIRYIPQDSEAITESSLLHEGDFVFADTSEDLDGCGNCVYIDKNKKLYAGYHTIILKNTKGNGKYLAYLFQTDNWRKQIRSKVLGVKVFSISRKILSEAINIIPPIEMQNKIVKILDVKCNTIDTAISKANASIIAYKSLKQSLITRAVTKGVRGKREMKDSGIEWIGEIPADWDVTRIKFLFELRNERNFLPLEEVNLISLYTDKGVIQHDDLEKTTGNKASNADGYKIVCKDDIVVNIILCWMGAIGRSDYEGVTSPAYDVYTPNADVDSRFYHHYFRTTGFNGDCYKRGKGIMAMRWRTYAEQFRDIKVVHPPMEEQQEILRYLDEKCSAIDTLIAKKEQLLSELETYKKSLIYEYVTGKREVPA